MKEIIQKLDEIQELAKDLQVLITDPDFNLTPKVDDDIKTEAKRLTQNHD